MKSFRAGIKYAVSLLTLLLAGCSGERALPHFTASGYLADQGTVRLWRKNSAQQQIHLQTMFTPFGRETTEVTDYYWQNGQLTGIKRRSEKRPRNDITLRFAQDGTLLFMQRQRDDRREEVSPQAVDLYRFNARRVLTISDALLSGQVVLKQGRWLGNGWVISCEGKSIKPLLSNDAQNFIARRQTNRGVSSPLYIAWLTAPQGTQLLLISHHNECARAPDATTF